MPENTLNSLEFATRFTGELDKKIVQEAVTGFFADNVFRAKFVGAKTVIVPDIDFVGLADYNRDTGYAKGKTTIANTSFTLTKDRGRQLQIDREDMDETGVANLAGKVFGEFTRTKVAPEIDAYTISKLAGIASTRGNKTEGDLTLAKLLAAINAVQAKAGFVPGELVAFLNPVSYAAVMSDASVTKQITISDFKKGDLNFKVQSLNGVALIPVVDDRMKTSYTFNSGLDENDVVDSEEGGFTPAADAKSINALILPKSAAFLVKKTENMRIFAPEQNQDADAYIFNYRLYYDVFVKKSNLDLIHAIVSK